VKAKPINPRSITDAERPWIDAWSENVGAQLTAEVAKRYSFTVAAGLSTYVRARAAGNRSDIVSRSTLAKYRKILLELNDEGLAPPPTNGHKPPRMFDEVNPERSIVFGQDGAGAWEQKPLLPTGTARLVSIVSRGAYTPPWRPEPRAGHVSQPPLAA
jgi:hypothetical protein